MSSYESYVCSRMFKNGGSAKWRQTHWFVESKNVWNLSSTDRFFGIFRHTMDASTAADGQGWKSFSFSMCPVLTFDASPDMIMDETWWNSRSSLQIGPKIQVCTCYLRKCTCWCLHRASPKSFLDTSTPVSQIAFTRAVAASRLQSVGKNMKDSKVWNLNVAAAAACFMRGRLLLQMIFKHQIGHVSKSI